MERLHLLASIESECLTAGEGAIFHGDTGSAVGRFLAALGNLAPCLPGPAGLFNAYGRVYLDGQHLEFAAAECDSPYLLVTIVDQQQQLATRALAESAKGGQRLILANNNHDGLLRDGAATWGCHENYLVQLPPERFGAAMLPFLATRVYAGAGGLHYPSGDFLAGVRIRFLEVDAGGGTTAQRAIHSTARNEHLMGPAPKLFRYHLVLGDGNRSQFSLALKCGATLLALQVVQQRPDLIAALPGTPAPQRGRRAFWMRALQRFNRLAPLGQPPRADPLAVKIQQLYLDSARRLADTWHELPDWVLRVLADWQRTLQALAAAEDDWLSVRLDPWIKHSLFSSLLAERGRSWDDLRRDESLFYDLAWLDQNYHEFVNPDSIFDRLEAAGILQQRVVDVPAPGTEAEPFVPATGTRARTRARFLREHAGDDGLQMNWDEVLDTRTGSRRTLYDPFATAYASLEGFPAERRPHLETATDGRFCFR